MESINDSLSISTNRVTTTTTTTTTLITSIDDCADEDEPLSNLRKNMNDSKNTSLNVSAVSSIEDENINNHEKINNKLSANTSESDLPYLNLTKSFDSNQNEDGNSKEASENDENSTDKVISAQKKFPESPKNLNETEVKDEDYVEFIGFVEKSSPNKYKPSVLKVEANTPVKRMSRKRSCSVNRIPY